MLTETMNKVYEATDCELDKNLTMKAKTENGKVWRVDIIYDTNYVESPSLCVLRDINYLKALVQLGQELLVALARDGVTE